VREPVSLQVVGNQSANMRISLIMLICSTEQLLKQITTNSSTTYSRWQVTNTYALIWSQTEGDVYRARLCTQM